MLEYVLYKINEECTDRTNYYKIIEQFTNAHRAMAVCDERNALNKDYNIQYEVIVERKP